MKSLFRLFSGLILKVIGVYVGASIVGILLLDRLFGGYEVYLGMLVFIAPILAWVLTFMLVPKNLEWIMALPISKRHILALHYLTSLLTNALVLAASVFVLAVLTLARSDRHVDLARLAKAPPAFLPAEHVSAFVAGIDIYGWMTGLLLLSFFHALSMSISRPGTTKKLYANLWHHANPWVRWAVRGSWIPLLAAAAAARDTLLAPFGIFVMAILVFLLLTTFNTANALGIPRRERRRWLAASGALAVAQIVFLFAHAYKGVRAESFDRRVASVMFLGSLSGGMARADLARMLEADLDAERIRELGELYSRKYGEGARARQGADPVLDFRRAIAVKKGFAEALATVRLFDPSSLGRAELSVLFEKMPPLLAECHCEMPYAELLGAAIGAEDALGLLANGNDLAAQYALLWARYHPLGSDPAQEAAAAARAIQAIRERMPRLPDRAKLSALLTASVIEGRKLGLTEWIAESLSAREAGRGLSGVPAPVAVDCARWLPKSAAEIGADQAGPLNACLRRRADAALIPEIEQMGWLEPPLDPRARNLVRRVLRIH